MKKATTTNETTFICVKPIIKAEYAIRIVGDSPLLVHAWSEKAKKEMLQAQQGKKLLKKDKVAKNPAGECAEALYWLDGKPDIEYSGWTEDLLHQYGKTARFGFPACAVKAAAISAAWQILFNSILHVLLNWGREWWVPYSHPFAAPRSLHWEAAFFFWF